MPKVDVDGTPIDPRSRRDGDGERAQPAEEPGTWQRTVQTMGKDVVGCGCLLVLLGLALIVYIVVMLSRTTAAS